MRSEDEILRGITLLKAEMMKARTQSEEFKFAMQIARLRVRLYDVRMGRGEGAEVNGRGPDYQAGPYSPAR